MLRLLSIAILLGVWYAGSLVAGERMLPGPAAVFAAIVEEARSGALALHLAATLARVALAFSLAMALGPALGLLMGRVKIADKLGDPWLVWLVHLPAPRF